VDTDYDEDEWQAEELEKAIGAYLNEDYVEVEDENEKEIKGELD